VAEDQVLVVVHGAAEPGVLVPPDPPGAEAWTVLVDSAAPERAGMAAGPLPLAPRSVVLLAAAPR
jgi:hypothetical protein